MKRFVTYLYEYKDAQKIKNTGYIRMDVRNQIVNMLVNIRYSELGDETGKLSIIVSDEKNIYSIYIGTIQMKDGQYQGVCNFNYHAIEESPYSFQDAAGVVILFEKGCYLASGWREEEMIARGAFVEYKAEGLEKENKSLVTSQIEEPVTVEEKDMDSIEEIEAAELVASPSIELPVHDLVSEEMPDQNTYRKINLHEIATLSSSNWHYTNNSFLLHGFWNYGYLVLKETLEAGKKAVALGIPGIFEQPEMVMAAYFGFPNFESLPSEVVEMKIGEIYQLEEVVEKEDQHPKDGTFGCWFVNLR